MTVQAALQEEPAGRSDSENPEIALLAVLGVTPPVKMAIAAGNVPNIVDLATGGWSAVIQDSLNSNQTQTMANFATIAEALSAATHAGNA